VWWVWGGMQLALAEAALRVREAEVAAVRRDLEAEADRLGRLAGV
jgi:hypothetical protein